MLRSFQTTDTLSLTLCRNNADHNTNRSSPRPTTSPIGGSNCIMTRLYDRSVFSSVAPFGCGRVSLSKLGSFRCAFGLIHSSHLLRMASLTVQNLYVTTQHVQRYSRFARCMLITFVHVCEDDWKWSVCHCKRWSASSSLIVLVFLSSDQLLYHRVHASNDTDCFNMPRRCRR